MVTAKKTAAKKVTAKKSAVKPQAKNIKVQERVVATVKKEEEFRMPQEVKDWIDNASSRIRHLTNKVARLEEDNLKLRRANKLMEQRVMGTSLE